MEKNVYIGIDIILTFCIFFIPCIFLKFKLLVQICKLFIPLHIFRFYYCALPYLLILNKKFETKEHFKRKNNKMNIKGKI